MSGPYWDVAWNPASGCTPVSPGCEHCWAQRMAERRLPVTRCEECEGRGQVWSANARALWTCPECEGTGNMGFYPTFHADRLDQPLHWRKPRRVFVCDMGDLFHEAFTDEQIGSVLDIIWRCHEAQRGHDFLVLTKRAERMHELIRVLPSNVWLGVTVCNQPEADRNIPILLDTPAAVRWVSLEPLLGPIDIRHYLRYNPVNESNPVQTREQRLSIGAVGRAGDRQRGSSVASRSPSLEPLEEQHDSDSMCSAPGRASSQNLSPSSRDGCGDTLFSGCSQAGVSTLLRGDSRGAHSEPQGRESAEQPSRESGVGDVFRAGAPQEPHTQTHAARHEEPGIQIDGFSGGRHQTQAGDGRDAQLDSHGLPGVLPNHLQNRSGRASLDLVILGGESGPGARPMQPEWALDVYRQCKAAGVPFFFKQWGSYRQKLSFTRLDPDEYHAMEATREYPEVSR